MAKFGEAITAFRESNPSAWDELVRAEIREGLYDRVPMVPGDTR